MAKADTARWMAEVDRMGIAATPVLSLDDLFHHEHLIRVGLLETVDHPLAGTLRLPRLPVTFSETPERPGRAAPVVGQDTRDVLVAAGLTDAEVTDLAASGVAQTEEGT